MRFLTVAFTEKGEPIIEERVLSIRAFDELLFIKSVGGDRVYVPDEGNFFVYEPDFQPFI